MPKSLVVLVTGATGKQGGAVLRELLKKGHTVRAFTRKADSAAAKELASRGAQIVQGSLDDAASLANGLRGADAVFAMSTPFALYQGPLPILSRALTAFGPCVLR